MSFPVITKDLTQCFHLELNKDLSKFLSIMKQIERVFHATSSVPIQFPLKVLVSNIHFFPNNFVRMCRIKLKTDMLYLIANTFQSTVF